VRRGKLEAYYLMFGQYDGFVIVDLPAARYLVENRLRQFVLVLGAQSSAPAWLQA
jgi:hypothetical protein